jgi:hypothetical protein
VFWQNPKKAVLGISVHDSLRCLPLLRLPRKVAYWPSCSRAARSGALEIWMSPA